MLSYRHVSQARETRKTSELSKKPRQPTVYVIAGPNGAGKTTFASEFLPDFVQCREFLNANLIASGLSPDDAFEHVRAARGSPVPDTPEQRAWVEQFAQTYPMRAV